jgi:uncharacterized DUF497 family protein
MVRFVWTAKNREHIAEHGVTTAEAEYVAQRARPPYPQRIGDDKYLVKGPTSAGRYIQVIYVYESDAREIDYAELDLLASDAVDDAIVVIHARPLSGAEKTNLKRKRRRKGQ